MGTAERKVEAISSRPAQIGIVRADTPAESRPNQFNDCPSIVMTGLLARKAPHAENELPPEPIMSEAFARAIKSSAALRP